MTVRPIIFSTPMVLALIAGRKTMTRRLATSPLRKCRPGDQLWVRESVRRFDKDTCDQHVQWIADDRWNSNCRPSPGAAYSVPSIHMPRWASRLTLPVDAVKVERLHELTDDDAIAEGMQKSGAGLWCGGPHKAHGFPRQWNAPRDAFADLWDVLHGAGAWDKNPEVVAISFAVEKRNVDGDGWDGWWEQ